MNRPPTHPPSILARKDALELHRAARKHGTLDGDCEGGAVPADLGGVVDEVLGGVGVVARVDVVGYEDVVGEVG